MAELIYHYGNYAHEQCEVYAKRVSVVPLRSDDGIRWGHKFTIEIAGDFVDRMGVPLTPPAINDLIDEMDTAYGVDYQDTGFKLDGVWTPHHMLNSDTNNLSGVRVEYKSWDSALPTEWANTRSFTVVLSADYLSAVTEILEFSETTTKIGTGGPKWILYETWDGDPVREDITNQSRVLHVTVGKVKTLSGFVSPPLPYWPLEEQEWNREVTFVAPRNHGHPDGKFTHYETHWKYYFERIGPDATTPYNTWYVP